MTDIYVPIVHVDIEPEQNAERTAIEKTTRHTTCPVYEVALIRATWGRSAKRVSTRKLPETANPFKTVHPVNGLTAMETERKRLTKEYPKAFDRIYADQLDVETGESRDAFAAAFDKVAVEENPWLDAQAVRNQQLEDDAAKVAAESLVTAAENVARKKARTRANTAVRKGRGRRAALIPSGADSDGDET